MSFDLKKIISKKVGVHFNLFNIHDSADSYLLAKIVAMLKVEKRMLTIIVANAVDAQRLLIEIPWFYQLLLNNYTDKDNIRCHIFPDWETLPYDVFSPHQDLISERLATLYAIQTNNCDVLIIPAITALSRITPQKFLTDYTYYFQQGEKLTKQDIKSQLILTGYVHVTQVMLPGEYSIRGDLLDLFPMGSTIPYRIDIHDNIIQTIRSFNIETQRSLYFIHKICVLPGREFPINQIVCNFFCKQWHELFGDNSLDSIIYKNISNGIIPAGIEYYLPLFFEKTSTIFQYIPIQGICITIGDINQTIKNFWKNALSRYNSLKKNSNRFILTPKDIFLNNEDFYTFLKSYKRLSIQKNNFSISTFSNFIPNVKINRYADDPLKNLRTYLSKTNKRVILCVKSNNRRERIEQYLKEKKLYPVLCENYKNFLNSTISFMLSVAPLYFGFELFELKLSFITEADLYADSERRLNRKQQECVANIEYTVRDLSELKVGDLVVHINHGIGRYMGLQIINLGEGDTEFIYLEYAKKTKLYVPVLHIYMISRYSFNTILENTPLHTLGSTQWEKAKQKATQHTHDIAVELLNLYAQRASKKGHAFQYSTYDYKKFIAGFGFEETLDQTAAINAVIADMTSNKPMDRLICGDVGFGKTEVALRAAFIAVMDKKQVAILAPTTLLAEQHTQIFSDRFSNLPVRIAELSRFLTKKEITKVMQGMINGTIDIVIGTHKLLSNNICFARLGLIIIDEEHRFGVRQKETLKNLRTEVDVLTLTATPIPRTLGMALDGLRDFSIIATAPQKRLSIKTFVQTENESIIREACLRELNRGGQVYFLHNEVRTINNRKEILENLIPEARILIVHGQMHERDLEKVMRNFIAQRANILLCTTIIETGIDVPIANTIIISHADKLGLAQLHQLRGRVGRSHHQAYAYMLVNDIKNLTRDAQCRLEAIQQMEKLGSGFDLAMHDLEIRGVGEVLGDCQSGLIQEIGFQMYSDMLHEEIHFLKKNKNPAESISPLFITKIPDINLHVPALLPSEYCCNTHERLLLYKRFANCSTFEKINILQEELIDRFGILPDVTIALIETHKLRITAQKIGINKIDANEKCTIFQFEHNTSINITRIFELIQKNSYIKFSEQNKLFINVYMPNLNTRIAKIKEIIKLLTN